MKKLSLYIFLVLMFSLFTSHSFAEIKYKTYKKLPCSFNGAKVGTSTQLSFKKSPRCKNLKGYPLKRGTSVMVKRGTPVFAITNMKLEYAIDRSAKQRCKKLNKVHKKGVCDRPFDDVELMFFDKDQNQILFYHLMDTPFVPGFGKGECERPLEFGMKTYNRYPRSCGGYSKEITKNNFWVKKGDFIGHSGTTGKHKHIAFSFIINKENLSDKEKKLCDLKVKKNSKLKQCKYRPTTCGQCYYAPETRKDIVWENFPSDNPDYYLLPIINKEYYKEIGYKK